MKWIKLNKTKGTKKTYANSGDEFLETFESPSKERLWQTTFLKEAKMARRIVTEVKNGAKEAGRGSPAEAWKINNGWERIEI